MLSSPPPFRYRTLINLLGAFLAPVSFLLAPAFGLMSGLQFLLYCISTITNPPANTIPYAAFRHFVVTVGFFTSTGIAVIILLNLIFCLGLASGKFPRKLRPFQLVMVTLPMLPLLWVLLISWNPGEAFSWGSLILLLCFIASFVDPRPPSARMPQSGTQVSSN